MSSKQGYQEFKIPSEGGTVNIDVWELFAGNMESFESSERMRMVGTYVVRVATLLMSAIGDVPTDEKSIYVALNAVMHANLLRVTANGVTLRTKG